MVQKIDIVSRQLVPTVGLTRSSFMRAMTFQSTTKFLPSSRWFLGSVVFLTDKFGNLSLQRLELSEDSRSGTGCIPPAPVRDGPISEAQLGHGLDLLGETWMDSIGDKADHALAILAATIDPICLSSSNSDSE
jgi:hypothetical protein